MLNYPTLVHSSITIKQPNEKNRISLLKFAHIKLVIKLNSHNYADTEFSCCLEIVENAFETCSIIIGEYFNFCYQYFWFF